MAAPKLHIFPSNNFVDLTIYHFGYHDCPPLHAFGPTTRSHFLFHYAHSGKGVFNSRDEKMQSTLFDVDAGQGFMIWPGQVASYTADEKDPWSCSWVEFDGLRAKEIVLEAGLIAKTPIYKGIGGEEQAKMESALSFIAHSPHAAPLELIGQCYLFLSSLIASSLSRRKTARNSLQDFYVREAILYIENHFREDIRIEDIAASCNLHRNHLGKIFKDSMGTSLRDFLIKYRVNKACELLKESNHTIGEIAEMTGFSNLFNFSRTFKVLMGIPPRQWKDKNKLR